MKFIPPESRKDLSTSRRFIPGFEREVHGIEVDAEGNDWMRAVIEEPAKKRRKSKRRPPLREPPITPTRLPSRPVRHSTEYWTPPKYS